MTAVERNEIIGTANHIQTGRGQFFYRDMSAACIDNPHTPGNHIILRQHTVEKNRFHTCNPVFKDYFQCLRFILPGINSRKPFQRVFPFTDTVAFVAEITAVCPVCIFDNTCRRTIIAGSQRRKFLRKRIHGIGLIISRVIWIA